MDKNEMLIDRLREVAKGMDTPQSRTLTQAADLLENYRHEIVALAQIVEKQAADLDCRAKVFDEASKGVLNMLEQARGERDAVTRRMIELETQNAKLMKDFEASLLSDPCNYCANCSHDAASIKRCEESDLDCESCRHDDCVCKRCIDLDRWTWRGLEAGHAEA